MTDTELLDKTNDSIVATDEEIIDAAVDFINKTATETIYTGSLKIGNHILKHFFDGDIKLATSKNPKKPASFIKLCQREDLTVNPSQLGLMVRVASQEKFLSGKEIDLGQLSYTHKASLVKLGNDDQKTEMIKRCIKNKWGTRQLDTAIKEHLETLPSSSKPSLIRTTKKYITKIDGVLATFRDTELNLDAIDFNGMTEEKLNGLKGHLSNLQDKTQKSVEESNIILKRCSTALKAIEEIESNKKD
jgi:hypothetical protein